MTKALGTNSRSGLKINRYFSTEGVHPYDEVQWERRDVVMKNWRDNVVNFEQYGVEFPKDWSMNATTIVTNKYFRGVLGSDTREYSLKQLINRVVDRYTQSGIDSGYFESLNDANVFNDELTWLLLHQYFSFNSPVWFNVGTPSKQQVSACFILSVNDTMDSILNWYTEEGVIFKGGSGAGINLSRIRSSKELLNSGGTASGPVSFMRGADASAGTIKSGGATRRAAKMVMLDVDHPDVEEFIETKRREEYKIKALRDAGFDMDLGGADMNSVQYQNANNSVRVSDAFMRGLNTSAGDSPTFALMSRSTGEPVKHVSANKLFRQMAQAAWECADPGIQYDDTINSWHTCPESGRINGSNPCSEYMHLDNSSCNLASLNLMKFLQGSEFNREGFIAATALVITAMDISICFADFPTPAITETTHKFRQLGIGYANLGALLMATGHGYDTDGGRELAASITSLMQATAYRRSAELAEVVGAYEGYAKNSTAHNAVVSKHAKANDELVGDDTQAKRIRTTAKMVWSMTETRGKKSGYRNAQVSVIAPTGTIGFMMDCDTTGVEPDFALVKNKKLVGGGSMSIVNQTVPRALTSLGYQPEQVEAIVGYIAEHGHVIDAPSLRPEHYEVFDCAMGERAIAPMGHVRMMAAVQPFISGAISKTVNMPEEATVEDVEEIYYQAWKMGVKALAIYRDNCKVGQPLSTKKAEVTTAEVKTEIAPPKRRRLPKTRRGETTSFEIAGAEGYVTTGRHEDGTLGEIFVKMSKQGSTLAGIMDAFSIAVSIALQHGVPLQTYVEKFVNMRFEPAGMTDDSDFRMATSIVDYLFRRLALDTLTYEERASLGVLSIAERNAQYEVTDSSATSVAESSESGPELPVPSIDLPGSSAEVVEKVVGVDVDAPLCFTCGVKMRRAGSCYVCESCGSTSGCS